MNDCLENYLFGMSNFMTATNRVPIEVYPFSEMHAQSKQRKLDAASQLAKVKGDYESLETVV